MAARVISTGASTNLVEGWHAINWQRCHDEVRRIQARIVKAVQAGRWNKVKALQHLLVSSFSGKALAVKRVTDNRGKNTPGIDGEKWSTPESKFNGLKMLKRHGYRAKALKRIYIDKANGGKRPLSIPCMADRSCQALYLQALDPVSETLADRNSYGFRKGRSVADAIEQCFKVLGRKGSAQWIFEADIRKCFDTICQSWILKNIPMDKEILGQWLKAGYMDKSKWFPTNFGVSQGGPISPTVANMVLDGLEHLLHQYFKNRRDAKVNFVRYCDDFIITGSSQKLLEDKVKPLVITFLAERGLTLSEEKTKITHISEGFNFLGTNIRKHGNKCLTKPSKEGFKRITQKLRQETKRRNGLSQEKLICALNPMIRGWTNFHCHNVSKETFSKLGKELWNMTWQWSKRRHLDKGRRWIKDRYFHTIGNNNWNFACTTTTKEGKTRQYNLLNPSSVPIKRHIKIKGAFNPYDPIWYDYQAQRQKRKTLSETLIDRPTLAKLLKQQNGLCPQCQQSITVETGWNVHHIVPKAEGGSDDFSNLVLLHPNCHRQHHVVAAKSITKLVRANKRGFTKARAQ